MYNTVELQHENKIRQIPSSLAKYYKPTNFRKASFSQRS